MKRPEAAQAQARQLIRTGRLTALEDALPALRERATAEAGEAGVMAILKAAFVHFPQPKREPVEWGLFWRGYVEVCGSLSFAALAAGMQRWLADPDSQFLPKPGELRQVASQTPTEEHQVLNRARAILEAAHEEGRQAALDADLQARGTSRKGQAEAVREISSGFVAEMEVRRKEAARIGVPHAGRAQVPKGELTAVQADMLRRCGKLS